MTPLEAGFTSAAEVTTVADDEVVVHAGVVVHRFEGLTPDADLDLGGGLVARTLVRPPGERLATVCTVNDVHFGEVEAGRIDELADLGPVLRSEPGAEPYPEVMNRAAAAEIAALAPDAVVAKGDLTAGGLQAEYDAFLACYGAAFGDRLVHVRGNHDAMAGLAYASGPRRRDVPGLTLAVLDTVIPGHHAGWVDDDQLAWLDDLAATADRPVLVLGHHHAWDPASRRRPDGYFGIHPDASERLVEVVARRPSIVGVTAGHTHRNRVRRFSATGAVPWIEVACTKDFPGTWAEYRVFEGGIEQVHRRTSTPAALAWSEACRAIVGGLYPGYAFGSIADRCLSFGGAR